MAHDRIHPQLTSCLQAVQPDVLYVMGATCNVDSTKVLSLKITLRPPSHLPQQMQILTMALYLLYIWCCAGAVLSRHGRTRGSD